MPNDILYEYEDLTENELKLLLCLNKVRYDLCPDENGRNILKQKNEYISKLIESDIY